MEEATAHGTEGQLQAIGVTDLVVGILDANPQNTPAPGELSKGAAMLREVVDKLRTPARTVVVDGSVHDDSSLHNQALHNQAQNGAPADRPLTLLPATILGSDAGSTVQRVSSGYRRIFELGQQLDAKACCVVASSLDGVTSRWFYWLAQPILEFGYDLVTPCYLHTPFEGLLNSSIISPLHSALYGYNLQNPIGPDVGVSKQAVSRMLGNGRPRGMEYPPVSLLPEVASAGLKVCQANLGRRVYPPTDWATVSSLLPPILGPIFSDVERNAAVWQRIRGVRTVTPLGDAEPAEPAAESVDISRMIESFQLGIRDLREIWSLVLPPSTLLELTKLARLSQDKFCLPDPLWARIIYDFAASHRQRTLNRDHLLRALTPLYLGWVASYALQLQAGEVSAPALLARLAPAFEAAKPYFVSRWRWPDRFNP